MEWTKEAKEAKEAISKVPFFVRKRVKKRVEEQAASSGALKVCLEHVQACKRKYLEHMDVEVKGYDVDISFGASGCRNSAILSDDLPERIEKRLSARNLKKFLEERVKGPLKMHHEFRVSISECPNACSRPQIVDLGLIGACRPVVTEQTCNRCGACEEVCRENAISLEGNFPIIDPSRCLSCGKCIDLCPTGTLKEGNKGYRLLLGGKLGRHPRLGKELPDIYEPEDAVKMADTCLDHYQKNCKEGERFGEVLDQTGWDWITEERKCEKE